MKLAFISHLQTVHARFVSFAKHKLDIVEFKDVAVVHELFQLPEVLLRVLPEVLRTDHVHGLGLGQKRSHREMPCIQHQKPTIAGRHVFWDHPNGRLNVQHQIDRLVVLERILEPRSCLAPKSLERRAGNI